MKQCSKCKETKGSTEFYHREKDILTSHCKKCRDQHSLDIWNEKRQKAIAYLGGQCIDCKKVYSSPVYDFHHLRDKEAEWNKLRLKSWDKILKELDKCVLLCANCHRLRHYCS